MVPGIPVELRGDFCAAISANTSGQLSLGLCACSGSAANRPWFSASAVLPHPDGGWIQGWFDWNLS